MKIIIKSIVAFCLFGFVACENMNDLHQKYLERGEGIYTGVIDSLKTFPGNERVKFSWEINSDPRITKTLIYWNERADSLIIDVNRTAPGIMAMETVANFAEGSYIFEFVTKDNIGNQSLSVSKTVEIYGSKYIQKLRNRSVKNLTAKPGNAVLIDWADIEDTNLLYTIVKYTDYTDPLQPVVKEVKVENKSKQTTLTNIKLGDKVTVISTFLPLVDALDMVNALPREYILP